MCRAMIKSQRSITVKSLILYFISLEYLKRILGNHLEDSCFTYHCLDFCLYTLQCLVHIVKKTAILGGFFIYDNLCVTSRS